MTIKVDDFGTERRATGASTDKVLGVRLDGGTANVLDITPGGGIVPASNITRYAVGGFWPATLTTGTDTTPVAGTVYFGSLMIPHAVTITGVGYLIGSVGGTDKAIVALYNSAGTLLANSALAGTTVGTNGTIQEIAFTSAYSALGPARYWVSVSVDGTTCRLRLSVANGPLGGSAAGSFGTLASITPATTSAAYPIAYCY